MAPPRHYSPQKAEEVFLYDVEGAVSPYTGVELHVKGLPPSSYLRALFVLSSADSVPSHFRVHDPVVLWGSRTTNRSPWHSAELDIARLKGVTT